MSVKVAETEPMCHLSFPYNSISDESFRKPSLEVFVWRAYL
jgi:hypothetical protein